MKWTKFEPAAYPPNIEVMLRKSGHMPDEVWRNNLFEVQVRRTQAHQDGWPPMVWLSIKHIDKAPIDENHWRTLQRIKNELVGPECEAVELFPAESRLVDTSNQYHLFCFSDPEARFPFGFLERLVSEKSTHGAIQRPWSDDDRPADLQDNAVAKAMDEIHNGTKTIREAHADMKGER